MQFTKYNNPAKKRAAARRKQANLENFPYVVVVMTRKDWDVVEKKRFARLEDAQAYASIYDDNTALEADVRF